MSIDVFYGVQISRKTPSVLMESYMRFQRFYLILNLTIVFDYTDDVREVAT